MGEWPRVAVVGAGAVGGYFGGMLARAGADVLMIGRKAFVETVNRRGLLLDTVTFKEVVHVRASTEMNAVQGADIVLFCVKTTDTVATAKILAPFLSPDMTLLCLQNGVDNVEAVTKFTNIAACPAVVYLAAMVPEPGWVKHSGRGDLVIGPESLRIRKVVDLFGRAGVSCRISNRIDDELWEKFICNCGLNAVSALCQATYGRIRDDADAWSLVEAAVAEGMEVAHASGFSPFAKGGVESAIAAVSRLTQQIAGAVSSTAQDLHRGKATEIGSLNGFMSKRGSKLKVSTPVNQALYALVKLHCRNK